MIGCVGKLTDASKAIDIAFKEPGSEILLLGERKNELGGSVYYELINELGANLPIPDLKEVEKQNHTVVDLIQKGLLLACHDISDGGLAVALAEMSFPNYIGCKITVQSKLLPSQVLFSETGGFVLEVSRENLPAVLDIFKDRQLACQRVGTTTSIPQLSMQNAVKIDLRVARERWENGLREKLL